MSKLVLALSHDDLHAITEAADKVRPGGTVKVPRDALAALLLDHGKLIREHKPSIGGVL